MSKFDGYGMYFIQNSQPGLTLFVIVIYFVISQNDIYTLQLIILRHISTIILISGTL